MQVITVTFSANQIKRFELSGKYFEIISSGGPVSVDFYDQNGSDSNGALNILSGFFVEGDFSSFNIRSATAQTVEILVTGGKGGSRRQPGVVQVVDTAKFTTEAGQSFAGKTDSAPGAALFGAVQLWNPAGSGRRVIVESILITNAAVAQNVVVGISPTTAPLSDGVGTSKLSGGASAVAQVKKDNNLAAIGSSYMSAGISLFSLYLPANGNQSKDLKRPIILLPGFGLAAIGTIANATHGCAFDWYEEVI